MDLPSEFEKTGVLPKSRLNEMDFMRPIVIILCVAMHSFTIYSGGGSWEYPIGINAVTIYRWIQVFTYGCMLEAFTFISGYLFGFQLERKKPTWWDMVATKLKRLIIPSIVFGIIYLFLFNIFFGQNYNINWKDIIFRVIAGAGHLWYLPMLFLCFLFTFILEKIKINRKLKLAGLFLVSFASVYRIPFDFNTVFHYLPFFYLGVYMYNNPPQKVNVWRTVILLSLFAIVLVAVTIFRDFHSSLSLWQKTILWYIKQLYATIGTLGIFFVCIVLGKKRQPSNGILQFNACCFGIYIFHQFILVFLYYHSSIPALCGSYLLPWIGLFLSFSIAYVFTWLLRKTNPGKYLLG